MSCICQRSHDITFCTGERCKRLKGCHRFKGHHDFQAPVYLSIAAFADHDGNCEMFWDKEFKEREKNESK